MNEPKIRYPENLVLKAEVEKSGRTIEELADAIGVFSLLLSHTINGYYKGTNIIAKLKKELR
ncbi:hypothetical protein [Pedobacter xixiisoli]|uniref:Uncharacterized protein n=1 Tax=Pedobacter xixiisoli TaxID=1476464 RepID=A0A286AEA7_9SPHI|nr:hypothetical protein [Pedobacter xixiisoli]SOD20234.1 hypothetical protein SAMN06297358_3947 [Pedobacter xixiisoli]